MGAVWTFFFSHLSFLFSFSLSLGETARYRLKYFFKGPLSPGTTTCIRKLTKRHFAHRTRRLRAPYPSNRNCGKFYSPPGRVAQSIARLTQEPEVPSSIPGPATYFRSPSTDSRRAVASFWRKYVHEVLVNGLEGLSLPRKSVGKLT